MSQRLTSATPDAWARLEAVDPTGRVKLLCWFGPVAHLAGGDHANNEQRLRGVQPRASSPSLSSRARGERPSSKTAVAALVATVLLAGFAIGGQGDASSTRPPSPPEGRSNGSLVGYEAVETETETYAPGTTRSLDESEGLHQVTVVLGNLTVEDGGGHRRDYVAGQSYVAGWAPYALSNRADVPLRVTVRQLRPSSPPGPATPTTDPATHRVENEASLAPGQDEGNHNP